MVTRANYSVQHRLYMRSSTTKWDYQEIKPRSGEVIKESRRVYLHIYYDDQRATDEKVRFNKLLDILEEELFTNRRNFKHEKLYQRYFSVTETPVKGIKVTSNDDVNQQPRPKGAGYEQDLNLLVRRNSR